MLSWLPRDPLPVGSKAPDFTLPTESGQKGQIVCLAGQKCRARFLSRRRHYDLSPAVMRIPRRMAGHPRGLNVAVFGVNPQSAESHREFRDRYKFPFPLLVDADQHVAALYNADGGLVNRTVYLIGPDGKIRYARRGMPRPQEVLAAAKIGRGKAVPA